MKALVKTLEKIITAFIIFILGNVYSISKFEKTNWIMTGILIILFFIINIVPSIYNLRLKTKRLRICSNGCEFLIV